MKRNSIVIGILVIVGVVAALVFGFPKLSPSSAPTASTAKTPQTATVQRGSLLVTVSAAGVVSASEDAALGFPSPGRVTQVTVRVGDPVKKGQLLMQQETTDLDLALKAAQANLANAQAQYDAAKLKNDQNVNQLIVAKAALEKATVTLQQAQGNYNAIAWRGDVGLTAEAAALQNATIDYQSALANYKITAATINDTAQRAAQAALDSAQIAVEQAQSNLDKTKILAPFDGTVAAVIYSVGNSAGTGNAVEVVNLSTLQVNTMLSKMDAPKVKAGNPAQMTLDELPGKTYTATVMSVGPVPVGAVPGAVTRGVVNYPVVFSVGNSDGAIKPGMTAKLNVQVDRRDQVLLIPSGAVQVLGTGKFVTVLVNGQPIQTPITTGLSNDQLTEVTSGLKEGDAVVLNP
jgi:HlyD family secretion protein